MPALLPGALPTDRQVDRAFGRSGFAVCIARRSPSMKLATEIRSAHRRRLPRRAVPLLLALVVLCSGFAGAAGKGNGWSPSSAQALAGCRIYVASGDDIANGNALNDNTKRYPEQLLNDHIKSP